MGKGKEKNKPSKEGVPIPPSVLELGGIDFDLDKIESDLAVAFGSKKKFQYLTKDSDVLMMEVLKRFNQINIVQNEDVYDCMLSRKLSQTNTVAAAIVSTGRGPTWEQAIADCVLNYVDYSVKVDETIEQEQTDDVSS